jgi:hypothetical protein
VVTESGTEESYRSLRRARPPRTAASINTAAAWRLLTRSPIDLALNRPAGEGTSTSDPPPPTIIISMSEIAIEIERPMRARDWGKDLNS